MLTSTPTPGFIKRDPVAWFASHRHTADGRNEAYAYSCLYAYEIALPAGAKTLTPLKNSKIRVLAVMVTDSLAATYPAHPLYN